MPRPLQIEFPGVFDHLTSRGDRREPIFVDDGDRHALQAVVAETMNRCNAAVLAYCLMGVRDAERAAHEAREFARQRRRSQSAIERHYNAGGGSRR